ncbi:unnamed protein product [Allacma fusca]|uniref:lysozyme n=1 Tax=Allacma fusca TaxID=39272 RepID=A0A8J2PQY3_9HEXA|nr:unnamed protein product [Allacma fusca]
MSFAFWILAACQILTIAAEPTGESNRFFPFQTTQENALRQRQLVERLQREYLQEQSRLSVPLRSSRQQSPFQAEIIRASNEQVQNLQADQQRLLIQQGQVNQQFQQQQLQQQVVQQQQLQFAPQFQPQTRDQAAEVEAQRLEVQKQQQATASAQAQFQMQLLQQQMQAQRAIQQQIQQQQIQEQVQLQQAEGNRGRGRSQTIELSRHVRQEPMTEVCLACICQASTSCNLTTQCISGGQYCGPFLISRPYWLDAGSPTLLGDTATRPGAFEDCTADPVCSAQTVRTYMTKYARDCNGDGRIDCNDLGRIHLMGAYGCADPAVEQSPFFQRFQQCVVRASSVN